MARITPEKSWIGSSAMFPGRTDPKTEGLSGKPGGDWRLRRTIIPFAHYGSEKIFSGFSNRSHVHLVVSPPIFPEGDDDPLSLTDRLMFTLARNLPQKMRGAYSELPPGFKI
jgi:hypothetical protein